MSPKARARIRTMFTVPSAAVLVLGASQLLASPPATSASRAPDCETYCAENSVYCWANPSYYLCARCGGCLTRS